MSIVKIINNNKRKPLYRFQVDKIEKIGFVFDKTYNSLITDKNVKKIFTVSNETEKDVCIHVKEYDQTLIILPFDERLFYCLIKFLGASKIEKEFIERIKG